MLTIYKLSTMVRAYQNERKGGNNKMMTRTMNQMTKNRIVYVITSERSSNIFAE